ncbi:MAG TPA: cytochrome c peroxidase [Verrucomicrobiae bacterium]|nr:cytochrome c peroxidase [Verrucomicrobiae bacterium]
MAGAILTLLSPCLSPAQTTNTAAAPKQVWHYADELDLTDAQRTALFSIRDRYESARAEVRRAAAPNTPPDAQRAPQLNLNDQFRLANRAIAELLTEKQKQKLMELRKAPRAAAAPTRSAANVTENPTAPTSKTEADLDAGDEDAPALAPSRKPPRKQRSDEEYRDLANTLRATYAQPAADWPTPHIDEAIKPGFREIGLLPLVVYPTNNPYTDAKTELGKKLFFERRLSGSGQISCASCHDPDLAFADGRTVSFGHERQELKRNAPTILNTAFNDTLFWDGRASSLEEQAMDVVNNTDEMHSSAQFVKENLSRIPAYTNEFAAVFGSPEITLTRVAQAIATFERTITSRGNNFDSFLRGDTNALSDEAIRGLHLFRTDARCINCHNGPNFTDGQFHNEGLTYYGRKLEDLGRYAVTKKAEDVGKFKTPSLRNIARTAPYMHNGLFDLDGVLNMYNAGMPTVRRKESQKDDPLFPAKSPHLQPLGLNKRDLADLKAFLESLTETRLRLRPPALPPVAEP